MEPGSLSGGTSVALVFPRDKSDRKTLRVYQKSRRIRGISDAACFAAMDRAPRVQMVETVNVYTRKSAGGQLWNGGDSLQRRPASWPVSLARDVGVREPCFAEEGVRFHRIQGNRRRRTDTPRHAWRRTIRAYLLRRVAMEPSGRYLAATKLPYEDRYPVLGDSAEVCIIDLRSAPFRPCIERDRGDSRRART